MPALLVFVFIVVPLIEIFVIIQVGQVIGAWWTIGLLVADSFLGAWLLRREGAKAWRAFREALGEGRWPGDEVAQGAMIIVGGTLLLTPGFITDIIGFLLLVPGSRRMAARTVRSRVKERVVGGDAATATGRKRGSSRSGSSVLDVEVVEIRRDDVPETTDAPDVTDASDDDDPDAGPQLGSDPDRA